MSNSINNIDQIQMLQIQQLLNDLQHQQQQNMLASAEFLSLNDLNQQQSLQNFLDIVTSPISSQQQQYFQHID